MPESTIKPQILFGISHRSCREGLCEEADCRAVHEVLDDFAKKYKNRSTIKYIDWEFYPLLDQDEEQLKAKGRESDGIIFIIENEIGKSQLDGYLDCISLEEKAPRTIIYLKRDIYSSPQDFKALQEIIHKSIKRKYGIFTDPDSLARQLEKDLMRDGWIEERIQEKQNEAGTNNGGGKYPKWFVLVCVLALILAGIATALLLFGNRRSSNEPNNPRIIDTTTVVAPKAGITTPSDSSDRKDSHRRGGTPIPQQNKLVKNGFSLNSNGIDDNFITLILAQIGSTSNLKQYQDNKNVRWIIIITEHKTEKGIALNGDYYADLSYTIDITDNETGAKLPPLTPFIKPGIKSAVDYDTAFRKARTQSFAEEIANGIAKKISNEN